MRTTSRQVVLDEADLLRRARAARERAYAPFTGFRVGAIAVTDDGQLFEGVNVESAASPLGICAEAAALAGMATAGMRSELSAIAIVGDGEDPCTPCGGCRQLIFEFGPDAIVLASGDGGRPLVLSIRDLLPHPFGPRRLAQGRD